MVAGKPVPLSGKEPPAAAKKGKINPLARQNVKQVKSKINFLLKWPFNLAATRGAIQSLVGLPRQSGQFFR